VCDFAAPRVAAQAIISLMYRAPKTADLFHAPPEFLHAGDAAAPVALPIGGCVKPATVRAFVRAMQAQGIAVQPARLGYDRLYAFDCFARAHACNDETLRALAVEMFAAFERNYA
jgi:hypothetical protein